MSLCLFLTSPTEPRTIGPAFRRAKGPGLRDYAPAVHGSSGLAGLPRTGCAHGLFGLPGSRGLDGAIVYLVALAVGVLSSPGSSGEVALSTSSANLRWLANSCSAKS